MTRSCAVVLLGQMDAVPHKYPLTCEEFAALSLAELTLSRPCLCPEAAKQIKEIRWKTISSIFGNDRFWTNMIFDALEILPPLAGQNLKYLLLGIDPGSMTLKSKQELQHGTTLDHSNAAQENENILAVPKVSLRSSIKISAVFDEPRAQIDVEVDLEELARLSNEPMVEVLRGLQKLSSSTLSDKVKLDCAEIIDLRFSVSPHRPL